MNVRDEIMSVIINGMSLTIEDVIKVARCGEKVEIAEEAKVAVEALNLRLAAATSAVSATNKDDLDSYKDVSQTDSEGGKTVRTFRLAIYLEESGKDQTELNSGKMLTAALRIKTLGAEGEEIAGVTGVIAAANVTQ